MKKLIFAFVAVAAAVVSADEVAAKSDASVPVTATDKGKSDAARAEMRNARDRKEAEMLGISVEQLRGMSREDRRILREAKMVGMPVEEWKKLDKKERHDRKSEIYQKRRDEQDKKLDEKKGVTVEELRVLRQKRRDEKIAARKRHDAAKAGSKLADAETAAESPSKAAANCRKQPAQCGGCAVEREAKPVAPGDK